MKTKVKVQQCFRQVHGVFFGIVILVLTLSFVLAACTSDTDKLPAEEPTELTVKDPTDLSAIRIDGERLVALAVCRVYDGNGMSFKSSSQGMEQTGYLPVTKLNTDDQYPNIKYPFDFVQIRDGAHFIAGEVNFPFLNEICGNGAMEIFLTTFDAFVYADEAKDANRLNLIVSDGLIVFRGELGIYACMDNSGSADVTVFSSHKRFAENAVEKDFTPPLYEFYIKSDIEGNVLSLACRVVVDKDGNFHDKPLKWTELQGGDIISSENLFSSEELLVMPEFSQQCTITGIGEDYFMVSGKYNLQKICFDEYTLFVIDDQPAKSTDFTEGDIVTVTFDKLYDRYNPKVAVANKIEN